MSLRLSDLPQSMRDKLEEPAKRKRQPKGAGAGQYRGRCQCGLVFTGERGKANWERHSDQEGPGHRRFTCDTAPRSVP